MKKAGRRILGARRGRAPPSDFSAARAFKHIESFARRPHPIGSAESAATRDYIAGELRALGLDPQIQTAAALGADHGPPYSAGVVRNVVARLKGAGGGAARPVLLAAHYDSVPAGPGASDDGVGVAALLETARALKSGPLPPGDVIFLFTEGEEAGLLGARAFVGQHPWAKEVGVALNFEARGNEGPVMMFETSEGNRWMVDELAAAPHPLANSLSYEIYRRMPNDTDMSVFKRGGMPGMNFAQIGGLTHYHTAADDVQSVSQSSLQHHGSYALSLARRFASLGAADRGRGDAVYFNLLGPVFVRYGAWLVLPLAALAALACAGLLLLGFRRGLLTVKGVLFGAVALVAACAAAALLVTLAWRVARPLHRGFDSTPWGDPYDGGLYVLGMVLLTLAVFAAFYNWFRGRTSLENLTAGALLCWALLAVAASALVPGASYLLVWPLLSALVGAAFLFAARGRETASKWAALALTALPAVALFSPLVRQIFEALTLSASGVVAVLLVLLCGLLVPHFRLLAGSRPWAFPLAAAALGLALIAGGLAAAAAGGAPRMDSVYYSLNADTGEALWASGDRAPDQWTAQFFPSGGQRREMREFFPLAENISHLTAAAERAPLPAPEVTVVGDAKDGSTRTLRLRVRSPREAAVVSIFVRAEGGLAGASLDGAEAPSRGTRGGVWAVRYHAMPAEGVEVALRLPAQGGVRVRVNDLSYGLPAAFPFKPRPADILPAPGQPDGVTVVTKVFDF